MVKRQRNALIALIILGVLLVGAAGAWYVIFRVLPWSKTHKLNLAAKVEDATADNSAVVAKIKEHKWWAEPPISQAKIDGLVSNITQAYGTETVVFDAKCKSWSTVVTSESPDMVAEVIKKTGMKAPPAFVRMTGQDKWSKTRALAELLKALDEAEARKAAAK